MASTEKNIEAVDESSRSVAGYVGVSPEYKNSASIHNRPLREEDSEEKGETQKGLEAFALDTEDNEWNGTLGAVNPEAYDDVIEDQKRREKEAAEDEDNGGEGVDEKTKAARQSSAAEGAKASSDKSDESKPETAKAQPTLRTPVRK